MQQPILRQPPITVGELVPGMTFEVGPALGRGTYITQCPHVRYTGFTQVVWWLWDQERWSFDALSPHQELPGRLVSRDPAVWIADLKKALGYFEDSR